MKIKPFFPVFIVLVGVIAYAYYTAEEKPDRAVTATPRQYIEMVEKRKEERRERDNAGSAEQTEQAAGPPSP